jgi:hypothetical protein
MKPITALVCLSLTTLAFTGCTRFAQGTAGAGSYETGMAREEGSTPYAIGRTSAFQRAGFADANIAASREEAALDVSGPGTGELARRSAAATVQSPGRPPARDAGSATDTITNMTGDDILLNRIQQALSSTTGREAAVAPVLSIQTLNNLRINVRNGVVVLRGIVPSFEEKQGIDALVRQVPGVQRLENQLEIVPSPSR